MTKALIIGANGQLGSDITQVFDNKGIELFTPNHSDFDLLDYKQMFAYILLKKPSLIVNTAAFHNVDLCEEMEESAYKINAYAPSYLAKICKELNIKFIHFSTDYVFDGTSLLPYNEFDNPNPLNVYGLSKNLGENLILRENENALILRVSALYGKNPCRAKNGLNFIQLMLKLASQMPELNVVNDEIVSPTNTLDIATILPVLIAHDLSGIAHLTAEGQCSWYEFAKEIFDYTNTKVILNSVDSSFFKTKTLRPKYSVIENVKIKAARINSLPHWKTSLHKYLDSLIQTK